MDTKKNVASPKEQVINELYKPARKNFKRRSTIIKGFDDLWQADLAEMQTYGKENRGYKFILVVIDCYSKHLWTEALKNKTASEVASAMQKILNNQQKRIPHNLQTDDGKEFKNTVFKKLMLDYGINHYSTYSVKKAAIAERVIRTLKNVLYKMFHLRGKYKWIDILQDETEKYNNRRHSTTGMKPINVKASTKISVYSNCPRFPFITASQWPVGAWAHKRVVCTRGGSIATTSLAYTSS